MEFTLEQPPTSPMSVDFNPSGRREDEEMQQEFLATFEGIRPRSSANSGADPSDVMPQLDDEGYGPEIDLWNFTADEILGVSETGGEGTNLSAGATRESPLDISEDSPPNDFVNQDGDATDFYNHLNREDWSTGLSDWTDVPDQALTQNANDMTLDVEYFNDVPALGSDEANSATLDLEDFDVDEILGESLEDFNVDETLGTGAEGLSDFVPQPLFTRPAVPQPLSGMMNFPASHPGPTFPPPPLVINNGGRSGYYILLKAGKPVCNVDSGSVPAVLGAISRSQPQRNIVPQQQELPVLGFSSLDAVDGASQFDFTLPQAALLGDSNWENEFAAQIPPLPHPRPAQIIVDSNLTSSSRFRPHNERQPLNGTPRMLTKSRDRNAQTPPNGVGMTRLPKPKKVATRTIEPVKGSDFARHHEEAEARALALEQLEREQATSPETLLPSPRLSRPYGGHARITLSGGVGRRPPPRVRKPTKDSEYGRHQKEAKGRALGRERAQSPISLPSSPESRRLPSPPAVRHARPRPIQRDRAQLRTRVNEVSKEKESSPGYGRRATRRFTKEHNIELESL